MPWTDFTQDMQVVDIPLRSIEFDHDIEFDIRPFDGSPIRFVQCVIPHFERFLGSGRIYREHGFSHQRLCLNMRGFSITIDTKHQTGRKGADSRPEQIALAQISRCDGRPFSYEQYQQIQLYMYWVFSFARGARTGPVRNLYVDAAGRPMWQFEGSLKVSQFESALSWLPQHRPEMLQQICEPLCAKLDDPEWGAALKFIIHWYVEANVGSAGIEASLIMAQIALELLCALKVPRSESLKTGEKIRRLLRGLQVDTRIPESNSALAAAAEAEGWDDGPHCLVSIRDLHTHPSAARIRALDALPQDAVFQLKYLALHYIEYGLLQELGYAGWVLDRTELPTIAGRDRKVPWVTPGGSSLA